MNNRVKEALIIAGISIAVIFMTTSRSKASKIKKPDVADKNEVSQKENARIALDAYMSAVENKENARALQSLNNQLASSYGLRIYKQGAYYVAKDSSGKEILYGK